MKRRKWLKLMGLTAAAGVCGGGLLRGKIKKHSYRFAYQQFNFLRPPGALPEKMFMESCINCGVCAQVCPTECIRFFTQDMEGKVKPNTPYIVAADRACNLCLECTKICPTGALLPVKEKKDVRMGLALLEENLCLPYINQGGCGACYTICPVNAVYLDRQRYPKVINDKCVGCGLCEEVCLQKVKAIRIVRTKTR
jgi:ferredoxin-type protein NapG/ferredoxin-type protein NapH